MNQTKNTPQQQPVGIAADRSGRVDPLGDGISSAELVCVSGSDIDIVNAARVSFGQTVTEMSKRDEKLVQYLVQHDHVSPLEHNRLTFRVKAPIFVQRQWFRHRSASYNEISYRYVKASLEFYIPSQWRHQDKINRQASSGSFDDPGLTDCYKQCLQESVRAYEHLLENGVAREIARGVLPMCTYTEFLYTCNLRSLTHFLGLRLDGGAQYEIRKYARALLEFARPHFPIALDAWSKKYGVDITPQK